MIKKKLSRIEDFISPTCFSYPANTFKDSYKVPFTPTLYKTSYGNSFYFLYSIIRTKICFLREAKLCNTLKKTKKFSKKHFVSSAKIYRLPIKLVHRLPYLAGASLRLPRLQRGMTSEVSYARYRLLAIPRCKRGKLVLAVHPLRGCKPSVCLALLASPKVMHEFAPQTIPEGDAPHEANPQTIPERDAPHEFASQTKAKLCGASLREAKRCKPKGLYRRRRYLARARQALARQEGDISHSLPRLPYLAASEVSYARRQRGMASDAPAL